MSNQSYQRKNNPRYFAEFFEKGYMVSAVLLAAIFTTILAVIYQFDLFSQVEVDYQKSFMIIFFVFYLALVVLHACCSCKKDKVGSGDALCVAFMLTALFFFLYLLASDVKITEISFEQIIIMVGCFVFGFVLTLLNNAFYNFYDDGVDENLNKSGSISLYKSTKEIFGFFGILICSLIINCIFYITLNIDLSFKQLVQYDTVSKDKLFLDAFVSLATGNVIYLVLLGIAALFIVIFLFLSIFNRKTNALDLFIFGFLFSIPVTFAMIYYLSDKNFTNNLVILGVATGIVLVLLHIRMFVCKKERINYLEYQFKKNLFLNKDTFLAVGLTALIVVFSNMANELKLLSVFLENNKINVYVGLIPYAILCVACFFGFIGMAISLVVSIAKLDTKHFLSCDRAGIYNFCFALFNLLVVVFVPLLITKTMKVSVKDIVILASYMFVSFGVLLMRKKSAK